VDDVLLMVVYPSLLASGLQHAPYNSQSLIHSLASLLPAAEPPVPSASSVYTTSHGSLDPWAS